MIQKILRWLLGPSPAENDRMILEQTSKDFLRDFMDGFERGIQKPVTDTKGINRPELLLSLYQMPTIVDQFEALEELIREGDFGETKDARSFYVKMAQRVQQIRRKKIEDML